MKRLKVIFNCNCNFNYANNDIYQHYVGGCVDERIDGLKRKFRDEWMVKLMSESMNNAC
jgi:hypothetical protein